MIESERGQAAAATAFMALLLAVSSLVAYGVTYRPDVEVAVSGLTLALPADWSAGRTQGQLTTFSNERRAALELQVFDHTPGGPVNASGELPGPEVVLQGLFKLRTGAALPANSQIETTTINGLDAAVWVGLTQSRNPFVRRPVLGLVAFAVVTDGHGRFWSLLLRDQNFPHEDPRQKAPEHAAQFEALLETLEPRPADAPTKTASVW